jgi:hypothetical protein
MSEALRKAGRIWGLMQRDPEMLSGLLASGTLTLTAQMEGLQEVLKERAIRGVLDDLAMEEGE